MKRRDGWTVLEVLIALVVGTLILTLGMQVVLAVFQMERRTAERDMLEDHLRFGLAQIAEDVSVAYGISDGIVLRPGDETMPQNVLYLLQAKTQSRAPSKSNYFGENNPVIVEYGLKDNEYEPPQDAPQSNMVLYRAEHPQMRSSINRKEPVSLYLNRAYREKVPGFSVRGFDHSGRETTVLSEVVTIEVTLAGKLKNGTVVQKTSMMPIGRGKGVWANDH